jgi:hypothetical protein
MKNLIITFLFTFVTFFAAATELPEAGSSVVQKNKTEQISLKKSQTNIEKPQTVISEKKESISEELKQEDSSQVWKVLPDKLSNGMTIVAILILLCACASKLSAWINMPCLLVFLGVGMLSGEQGIGHIKFDNPIEANIIGSIAMAFILFSGGFDTSWRSIKKISTTGGLLSSLGVLLTALIVGAVSFYFLR